MKLSISGTAFQMNNAEGFSKSFFVFQRDVSSANSIFHHQQSSCLWHCTMPPDITDLPENVVNAILMRLPLRDAVRTSILSKKWRYKWCKVPQLTLGDELWKTTNNLLSPSIKFTAIMYNILTLHSGPEWHSASALRFSSGTDTNCLPHFSPVQVEALGPSKISHLALENLRLEYGSVQFLAAVVPRRLSSALNYLKRLYVSLGELDDLSCSFRLIRSSPCLQDLEVKVSMEELMMKLMKFAAFIRGIEYVKRVGRVRNNRHKAGNGAIKLLLAKSPMLVRMLIEPNLYWVDKEKGVKILAELTTYKRASRIAKAECQLERKWT
ncbi:hypothetical protein HAX54_015454 [Datura stramonium]|uniref:F-box domain-containing protein n=1 Tax=Datura stramonium TaxID=4076 RepID=A0ABS8TTB0_DATST|nr:hypothetical protein [Datura stramonium]